MSWIPIFLFFFYLSSAQDIPPNIARQGVDSSNLRELRCHVCRITVDMMKEEIQKVDPKKVMEVGGYHFDDKGSSKQKKVQLRRSEVYLTELMEKVCGKFKDYIRARRKSSGKLIVMPLITPEGSMNPLMGEVDVIQDSDLNKSLEFYCAGVLEEFEESFVQRFSEEDHSDLKYRLCYQDANLCTGSMDEGHDEL